MAEVGSAFVSLMPSAKGFGKATEKQIAPDLDKSGKSVGSKFGAAIKVGAVAAVGAGVALGGFLKDSIGEAREAQKVGALTNAVIKSTGGVANVTAKDVDRLATSISLKTGVDDEAIAAGQNMLLTFGNVRNEVGKGNNIFSQATVAATDMAAAFGGDAVSNSKMLGKALNDPTKGVSALTRVGVSFTQGQKDQIKTLQESGNVLGAQKIILGELSKQTKGAAEAQATSGEKAAVAFGNLKEQIGTALLPVVDRLMTVFSSQIIPAVSTFVTQVQTGSGVGGQFASAFGTVATVLGRVFGFISQNKAVVGAFVGTILAIVGALKVWTVVQTALNIVLIANPIGIVIVAIAGLVAALVFAYKRFETFRTVVNAVFSFLRTAVAATIDFVRNHWRLILIIVGGPLGLLVALVTKHWDKIASATRAAWDAVKTAIGSVAGLVGKVRGWFGDMVSAVTDKLGDAVGFVKAFPGKITSALGGLGSLLFNAGAELIQGLINGITAKLGALAAKMSEVAGKIKGFLPGSPVKEGPLTSWNNGGAGKRLVGLLADGLGDTRPVDAAMTRLVSGATLPRSAGSLALAGVSGGGASGGGRMALTITNWNDGTGYFETIVDSSNDLLAERGRAR